MKWGVFDHVDASGRPPAQVYDERLRLIEAIDRSGAHAYFVAEHHGTPLGLAPSPNLLLAAASQRTTTIGLGALVYIAALYHPMRLAEEICMLDQLTHGRLLVGLGRGAVFLEQALYGIDPATVPARYDEARDIVLQALTGPAVDHAGTHHTIRDFPMVLSPVQRPHPPLWYGLGSTSSAEWAADNGVNCVVLMPATRAATLFDTYRRRWEGRAIDSPMPLLGLNRHVVVADSDARARAIAEAAFASWRRSFETLWKRRATPLPMAFPESWEAMEAAGTAIAGAPERVRAYLAEQVAIAGASYLGCQIMFGTMALDDALRSLDLLTGIMATLDQPEDAALTPLAASA